MADYYNKPDFEAVDVPVRAGYVRALEEQADALDPQHNLGESAVTVLDRVLAEALVCADCGIGLAGHDHG